MLFHFIVFLFPMKYFFYLHYFHANQMNPYIINTLVTPIDDSGVKMKILVIYKFVSKHPKTQKHNQL